MTTPTDEPSGSSSLFLRLEQAQSNHGIPHQDYAQYRAYCTKRLARLRRVKEVRSLLVHNPKYVSSSIAASSEGQQHRSKGGGRHAYASRLVVEELAAKSAAAAAKLAADGSAGQPLMPAAPHENIIWDVLVQAERAWAQACELQQQQQSSSTSSSSKGHQKSGSHHHIQRRLNKASKLAAQALELQEQLFLSDSTSACRLQQRQELVSYAAWMKGNAALQQQNHVEAFRAFQESRHILLQLVQQLSTTSTSSSDENNKNIDKSKLALADLWTTRAESLLKPLVRYCHYEARDELQESDILQEEESQVTKAAAVSSIVLSFRGQDIALDQYKELAVLYLKLEDMLKKKEPVATTPTSSDVANASPTKSTTNTIDETHFLQVLSDLDDALNWTKTEFGRYESLPAGPAVNAKRRELTTIQGYFQYQKLDLMRQQQEKRVNEMTTFDDAAAIVHMYDDLQQTAQAMADLPAAVAAATALVDDHHDSTSNNLEDDPFWLQAQAHVVRIRAFRCYYLARLYESVLHGTPAQVLALLKHCSELAKRAQEEVAACMDDHDETSGVLDTDDNEAEATLQALQELLYKVKVMSCRVEAAQFLQSTSGGGRPSTLATDRPLWLRLDDIDAGSVLADDPPLLIPLPAKPVFYDIAWQYISDPDNLPVHVIEEYLNQHKEEPKSSNRGMFSWLSG